MNKWFLMVIASLIAISPISSYERKVCTHKKKMVCKHKKKKICCHKKYRKGVYLSGFGGANFGFHEEIQTARSHLRTGFVAGGAAGYLLPCGLRFEAEAAYRDNGLNRLQSIHHYDIHFKQTTHGQFHSLSFMGNVLYNIPTRCWFVPYFGAGAGWANSDYHLKAEFFGATFESQHHYNGFAWQAIGGFSFVMRHFDLFIEYRYYNPTAVHYHDHNAIAGISFLFY